jgi:acyl carrier protein
MSNDIFIKIQEILAKEQGVTPEDIGMETTFESLQMDSLDALALVNELESEFDVRIPNTEVLKIRNVGQAVEIFQKFVSPA